MGRDPCGVETEILLTSYSFWPRIGGIESVTEMLARRFREAGRLVSVVTETPYDGEEPFPYPVIRCPSPATVVRLITSARCVLQNHPSLRLGWPLLGIGKPFVVAVHTWCSFSAVRGAAFRCLLRRVGCCVSISEAIAQHLPVSSVIVPNPYDEEIFWTTGEEKRTRDCVFVGRMVQEKGPLLFLEALDLLRQKGHHLSATFVGDGPMLPEVKERVRQLGMEDWVEFEGFRVGEEVAQLMRKHRILVVPSIWQEPFGIVAVEGIACGCAVVGSEGGGLKAAIGPCGLTFPNGDARALAARIEELVLKPERFRELLAHAPAHLRPLTSRVIAERYLQIIDDLLSVS